MNRRQIIAALLALPVAAAATTKAVARRVARSWDTDSFAVYYGSDMQVHVVDGHDVVDVPYKVAASDLVEVDYDGASVRWRINGEIVYRRDLVPEVGRMREAVTYETVSIEEMNARIRAAMLEVDRRVMRDVMEAMTRR